MTLLNSLSSIKHRVVNPLCRRSGSARESPSAPPAYENRDSDAGGGAPGGGHPPRGSGFSVLPGSSPPKCEPHSGHCANPAR